MTVIQLVPRQGVLGVLEKHHVPRRYLGALMAYTLLHEQPADEVLTAILSNELYLPLFERVALDDARAVVSAMLEVERVQNVRCIGSVEVVVAWLDGTAPAIK